MKIRATLFALALLSVSNGFAQSVAINATGATAANSAILDVSSTTKGFLGPRMTQAQRNAIPSPADGLLIYQTDGASGFWYYTGTVWIRIGNGNGGVTSVATNAPLSGGTITTAGTISISQSGTGSDGYLSSTDWNTFNSKVGGSGVATRVAFWGTATTLSSDALLYWNNTSNRLGIGTSTPVTTLNVVSTTEAIEATTSATGNITIAGFHTAGAGTSGGSHGVLGQTSQSGSQGLRGEQLNQGGFGVMALNFGADGAGGGGGVYAQTRQSNGFAADARNLNAAGTGGLFQGQNVAGTYLTAGSGLSANGVSTGIHARTTTAGVSQSVYTDNFGVICRVNYWSGTTQYKILGTGTVSTTAEGLNGDRVTLHCTEAPEIYFEDYGQGKLVNGRAHIEIDPIVAKNITVNSKHPLRVYIQLEGDCKGVFVTNKTANSFDVIELQNGNSNTAFQYHIVGNRADEIMPNGRVSKNADMRFEPAPKVLDSKAIEDHIQNSKSNPAIAD